MRKFIPLACLATVFTMGYTKKAKSQDDGDRKVRIEITTRENGNTNSVTREFDLNDEAALEDALREMGVFDEIGVINDGENLVIDLKRLQEDGGVLRDMSMALAMEPEPWMVDEGPFLGVYTGDSTEECPGADGTQGALIVGVIDDTPASKAGLKECDVITAIDDLEVRDHQSLVAALFTHEVGDEVKVTYSRDGKKATAKATLAPQADCMNMAFHMPEMDFDFEMPDDAAWPQLFEQHWHIEPHAYLGVNGEDAGNAGGARITGVLEGTSAERMGIREGDVIKKVNGTPVPDFGTLAGIIDGMGSGEAVAIELERDGATTTLNGTVGEMQMPTWDDAPDMPAPPDPPMMYRMPQHERDQLRREMDQLREEMDRLRRDLRGEVTREMTVVIGTVELSREETDVLRNKGVTGLDASWSLADLRCFPNPSQGSVHLEFQVPERGDLNVDIHDAGGERIYHETITGFKGRYERTLDLSDQADGTYFMVIAQNGKALARKLVKQ